MHFNFGFVSEYYMYYVMGLEKTLLLALLAVMGGTCLGVVVGLMRLAKRKLPSSIAAGYINFIRGTPMLVQIYIIYYGLSTSMPDMMAAVLALTINSGAYIAEIIRAGIQAVDKGQMEAARSLGMSHFKAMRLIVIPQAVKNILPALCNEFIIVVKDTSIVSVIGIHELMYNSDTVRSNTFLAFEPLIIAAFIYFVVTYILKKLVGILERRLRSSD